MTPRLKTDGSGYEWREFDRWLQTVQRLLGAYSDGDKAVNLFTGHHDNQVLIGSIGLISTISTVETSGNEDYLTLYWVGV
jgi:hypothetical protein